MNKRRVAVPFKCVLGCICVQDYTCLRQYESKDVRCECTAGKYVKGCIYFKPSVENVFFLTHTTLQEISWSFCL